MNDELSARVLTFVRRARAVTANEIARTLDAGRGDINSILYQGLGRYFRRSDDQPPKWSILEAEGAALATGPTPLPVTAGHDFHIDFAGGDWTLRIVIVGGSRNEPIARIEYLGERHRLVSVASYAAGRVNGQTLPSAAVAIASSVLAWEIHQSLRMRGIETFRFEEAVRDIFLSLTWQAAKLHESLAAD